MIRLPRLGTWRPPFWGWCQPPPLRSVSPTTSRGEDYLTFPLITQAIDVCDEHSLGEWVGLSPFISFCLTFPEVLFVCFCHDLLARVFVKIRSHIIIAVKARIQTNNKRSRCQRTWQLPEALKRARLFSRNPNCLQTNDWTGNSYYPNQDIYIYKDVYLLGKHAARSDW